MHRHVCQERAGAPLPSPSCSVTRLFHRKVVWKWCWNNAVFRDRQECFHLCFWSCHRVTHALFPVGICLFQFRFCLKLLLNLIDSPLVRRFLFTECAVQGSCLQGRLLWTCSIKASNKRGTEERSRAWAGEENTAVNVLTPATDELQRSFS